MTLRSIAVTRIAAFALFAAVGLGQVQDTASAAAALLKTSCAPCHNAQQAQATLRFDTLAALAAGGVSGAAVIPGDASSSLLLQRVTTTDKSSRMPPGGALPDAQVAVLRTWIDAGAPGLPKAAADFGRDVEPVLQAKCYGCHSGASAKAQLRLDAGAAALKGGMSGPVIVPGNSDQSRLVQRIEGRGNERRMPLGGALSDGEIAAIRNWIDSGAKWPEAKLGSATVEKHWAYRAPLKPANGGASSIDAFLLARLQKQGLKLQAEASRETLIRRASLDLIGLPPTPAEVDEFVRDSRPDAYERLIDRLLASPHYGERWARPWLDLARYADTNGFEKDLRRTMWKYRDWVVDALNRDMPFDQFTIEQLAGDLLPGSTTSQKIATGFHRNTMFNEEGGVDKDESRFEVLVDRVNTTGSVWLGTTTGCTQCHNHKFDPFTQKEYYQLMAFFNSAAKTAKDYGDTSQKWEEPVLDLPTPEQAAKRLELDARIKELEAALKTSTPEIVAAQRDWEERVRRASKDWVTLPPVSAVSQGGAKLDAQPDGRILVTGANPLADTHVIESRVKLKKLSGLRIEAIPHASLPRTGPGRDAYGNFIVSEVVVEIAAAKKPGEWRKVELGKAQADDGRANFRGRLWSIDASREDVRPARQLVLAPKSPVKLNGETLVRVSIKSVSELSGQALGHFRLSATQADRPMAVVEVRHSLRAPLEAASRTKEQEEALAQFYRGIAPALDGARAELKDVRSQKDKLGIATALVMAEDTSATPHDFIRTRGGFANKTERVEAGTPAVLNPMPAGLPRNRLGLAKWIVSRENPLAARVAVNRMWEQFFGKGIVETSEDFGTQGERPVHPELLDWLAVEFMDRGWSIKSMHKLIVMSAAYRQTSQATPAILQADPYNRLVSRGPRFRMEGEMIRDSVLAASGLLSRKVGGPSVFPPQPPGVWDLPYNEDKWEESKGEDRYRRALYTFVRRSAMYPAMLNFDATSREVCTVRRVRTNTPLAALTTLNDEAFFEAARALAKRALAEGNTENARITAAFRMATARAPKPNELDRLLTWLANERSYFEQRADEARKVSAGGGANEAAWTMLANAILNLDEALTKE